MKTVTYHYFKLQQLNTQHTLVFDGLAEFNRFVELNQIKNIFLLMNPGGEPAHFAVTHKGGVLQQETQGYKKLEDYCVATHKHFPDAATYYQALEQGYTEYEDFVLVTEAGISDKVVFAAMKTAGFITGFHEFEKELKQLEGVPPIGPLANAHQLFEYAKQQGFENFAGFKAAFVKGFKDADTFKIATERGFGNLADYDEAQQMGFRVYADLKFARENQVRNPVDALRFLDLQSLKDTQCSHDQRVLLVLLSKLEQGKKISINKLHDLLQKAVEEYRYTDTAEMPLWFTQQFTDRASVIDFMTQNPHVKKYGHYDTDGEFFEINHMKDRKVVIDGSNVAHNSNGQSNTKPYYSNIITLVGFLKQKGFTDITVITDASLRHRIADQNQLNNLKEAATYLEAPKETPADIFIIRYVKQSHCLLVSNDTFREWKVEDPWVAENIDFYRLTFLIKGEEVIMPDLK